MNQDYGDRPQIEIQNLTPIRAQLTANRLPIYQVADAFKGKLPEMTEKDAGLFLSPKLKHFGIADLLDVKNARLVSDKQGWKLELSVADLFLDNFDQLRFAGACEHIQPAVFTILSLLSKQGDFYHPFREWISFQQNRNVDYLHYYIGSFTQVSPESHHELDPSDFYTRLFTRHSSDATQRLSKESMAGESTAGYYIDSLIRLDNRVPYFEVSEDDRTSLVSVGLRKTEQGNGTIVSLNVIDHSNNSAPARTVEMLFDLDKPEKAQSSMVEKFVRSLGYARGCEVSQTKDVELEELNQRDQELITQARDRFTRQIRRILENQNQAADASV